MMLQPENKKVKPIFESNSLFIVSFQQVWSVTYPILQKKKKKISGEM